MIGGSPRYAEGAMTIGNGTPRRVGVFCGSSDGNNAAYRADAIALGQAIAAAGMVLVYGGAARGLMGAVADAALARGGEVVGVLPAALQEREIAHTRLSSLELVATMHQRKARIHDLSDMLIALPGGHGTLDELMEAVTWAQIGLHAKPTVLVNTLGYWDGLLQFLDTAVSAGFVKPQDRARLLVAGNAREALHMARSACTPLAT